ncbi:MAG: DUF3429 domain-containing protein [Pseudomonadota bacterium]
MTTPSPSPPYASSHPTAPLAPWVLGLAGALPFAALALAAFFNVYQPQGVSIYALTLYAALIASFLGGVHWGLAMAQGANGPALWRRLIISVAPALVAWAVILAPLPPEQPLLLLAALFVVLGTYDVFALARLGEAPAWYKPLRFVLSTIVVASLLLAYAGAPRF